MKNNVNWAEEVRYARKKWAGRNYDHLNLDELLENFRNQIDDKENLKIVKRILTANGDRRAVEAALEFINGILLEGYPFTKE